MDRLTRRAARPAPAQEALRFNQRASFSQANPNKTKQKSLGLLGFIWWNWDFSKGYSRKK
jgi:hypothetical protein